MFQRRLEDVGARHPLNLTSANSLILDWELAVIRDLCDYIRTSSLTLLMHNSTSYPFIYPFSLMLFPTAPTFNG